MTAGRFLMAALVMLAVATQGVAADSRIRIVLFTPRDVEPPAGVAERMREIVDYGQAFYGHWLQHWGYEPENVLPVDRDDNGLPVVYFVKGKETAASGKYDEVGYQGAIREQAISEYKLPRDGSTWWIFVAGTKLKASRSWGGFGDRNGNGLTLLVWNDVPGELTNETPLAGGVADRLNLKGYLHELGHTMSLPHIGPSDRLKLGMSLMGPNARTYRKAKSSREERVYLTPAVAALIWKQPQMTGRFEAKPQLPRIDVKDFQATYNARQQRFELKGRLTSDIPAHSIVAIDIPEKGPGDYWKKGTASRLEKDGAFSLVVDELVPSDGVLKVVFCFENGVFTGTGQGIGFMHAAEIPYRVAGNGYQIGK